MNKTLKQIVYWAPRALGILIVILLTLVSTDVFEEGYTFWQALGGFFMHMLPAFAVLIVLVLGWRREWIGALGFFAFAIWYIAFAWGRDMHWSAYALLTGIPGLIGALFLLGWVYREKVRG